MNTTTTTPLICSECGTGNYRTTAHPVIFTCTACGHTVNSETDVYPYIDADEMLTVADDLLAVEN